MSSNQNTSSQRLFAGQINLNIQTAGEGPIVLMVHGWPELSHSWRNQIQFLAEHGYRAVAVDVRGYGESDKPSRIEDYKMRTLCADIAGLIDVIGKGEKVILVGHDWGAPIVWTTALLHPDKVRAVAGLSVPHAVMNDVPPLQRWKKIYGDKNKFFYQLRILQENVVEGEFEEDVRKALRTIYHQGSGEAIAKRFASGKFTQKPADAPYFEGEEDPGSAPDWFGEQNLDIYTEAFQKGGFRGPFNRYRCQDLDWEDLKDELRGKEITQPAYFIAGEFEPVLRFIPDVDMVEAMKKHLSDFRGSTIIPGGGHWIQQEKPDAVNEALLQFIKQL